MPTASPDTPHSLLERARDPANSVAWERFNRLYAPLLASWFRASNLQSADADDLTQKAFQLLLRKLPEFEHSGRTGAFRTWLRNIVFNLLRDFRRANARQGPQAVPEAAHEPNDLIQKWDREHDLHVLNGLIELVRPDFSDAIWRAFSLTALEGKSATEASMLLDTTPNAVMLARSRVLARLRREAKGLLD